MVFILQRELFRLSLSSHFFVHANNKGSIMTIEQRVAFLERRCRHLTGLLIAAMAVTMVMFFGGGSGKLTTSNTCRNQPPETQEKYIDLQKNVKRIFAITFRGECLFQVPPSCTKAVL